MISSWPWLRVIDFIIIILGTHGEGGGIFVQCLIIEVVIAWPWLQGVPYPALFVFIADGYFGSRLASAYIVLARTRLICTFAVVAQCAADP